MTKTLLLSGMCLSIIPTAINAPIASLVNTDQQEIIQEQEEDNEGCTVMYVGSGVSADGKAIIARSSDSGPHSLMLNGQVFQRNELANTTVKGKNGFEWKMPGTTYRYVSTPRNPAMGKGLHWEASGINENGVGVSATLSCYSKTEIASSGGKDPFVRDGGISEDNFTQIGAAVAKSARHGVQYILNIIDQVGNADGNAVMFIDQDEAWYMELYSGHQYIAIKLPDDKATTVGNEFMLDSLATIFGEDVKIEGNRDIICSPDLFNIPRSEAGGWEKFAVFDENHEGEIKHLRLAETYGSTFNDQNHTRTWRGGNMFAWEKSSTFHEYDKTTKYPSFFTPDNPLSVNDVKLFMRDRYEDLIDDKSKKYLPWFEEAENDHRLHYVGNEGAYQIHIIKANPEAPKEFGVEEWLCLSSSNYAPFIPLSSGTTLLSDYYSYKPETYAYDDKAASFIYRQLYRLADTHREYYGLPTQHMFEKFEDIWQHQWSQVSQEAYALDIDSARNILTNFSIHLQNQAIELAKYTYENLLMHAIDDLEAEEPEKDRYTLFTPLIDLVGYTSMYGWSYKQRGKIYTLTDGEEIIKVDTTPSETSYAFGTITKDGKSRDIRMFLKEDKVYLDFDMLNDYFIKDHELVDINIDEYRQLPQEPADPMTWIVPVAVVTPIATAGAGVGATTLAFKSKLKRIKISKRK